MVHLTTLIFLDNFRQFFHFPDLEGVELIASKESGQQEIGLIASVRHAIFLSRFWQERAAYS
jgi:hypothetical protein